MKIGILAVQGAFIEHEEMLKQLDVDYFEIRSQKDLHNTCDGIILPGGESTVMGKLIRELHLYEPMKDIIKSGIPVLGTCAGMILLAKRIEGSEMVHFGTLPITVKRNGYRRQLGSFHTEGEMKGIGRIPMEFIRAPYVKEWNEEVEVLAKVEERMVGVRYKNQLAVAFHPELTGDTRIHEYFLNMN